VRRPECRIETGGGAELDERSGVLSALLQDDAEVVTNEGAVTTVSYDGAKGSFRRVELARRQSGDPSGKTCGESRRQILGSRPDKRRHEQSQCQRRSEHDATTD
jgi:hypothetical protein